ncbi:MAG: hydroxysqualene dehydroxylase HpnE [Dehalococcoidia bacterium]
MSVTVLGGGLAGMSAAWRLAEHGHAVTLVERRPYLGGRAYSFADRETGQEVDNGQHVFLGCCTAYTRFLEDIGTLELTSRQRRLRIEVRGPNGRSGVLSALSLPAPLHLFPSFLAYPHIGWREKLRAASALLRIRRERQPTKPDLQAQSFQEWLRRHGQSDRSIANFWDLIILPTLNDASADVSAAMGFMVFQEALLKSRHGANVGYAKAGLSEVMGNAVQAQLARRGARLLLEHTVEGISVEDSRVTHVTLAGGERIQSDAYISALPPGALANALPVEWRKHPAFTLASFHTWAPIVNLHIWYDRPIGDFDFLAFVESPVQWVFNRTRIAGLPGPGQYITVSLSGAWEYWPMSKNELRERFLAEMERLFPRARDANVERFIIVKEQHATFRSLPNGPRNRLPTATPIHNLFLAGDWTDTGWPATMEGAVRSGEAAAQAAQEFHHRSTASV